MVHAIALLLVVGAHGLKPIGTQSWKPPHHTNASHHFKELSRRQNMRKCVVKYADDLDSVKPGLGDSIRTHPLKAVATSDRPLVLGAGPGTTATRSLGVAFERLGLHPKHFYKGWRGHMHHMGWTGKTVPHEEWTKEQKHRCLTYLRTQDYTDVPEDIGAVLDTPVAENFINIYLAYPKAKVVLTERPGSDWIKQRNHNHPYTFVPVAEPCGMFLKGAEGMVVQAEPDPRRLTEENVVSLLTYHNQFVKCLVPPENFMEINVWTDDQSRTQGLMTEMAYKLHPPQMPTKASFPRFKVISEEELGGNEAKAKKCAGLEGLGKVHEKALHEMEFDDMQVFPLIQQISLAGCEMHLLEPNEIDASEQVHLNPEDINLYLKPKNPKTTMTKEKRQPFTRKRSISSTGPKENDMATATMSPKDRIKDIIEGILNGGLGTIRATGTDNKTSIATRASNAMKGFKAWITKQTSRKTTTTTAPGELSSDAIFGGTFGKDEFLNPNMNKPFNKAIMDVTDKLAKPNVKKMMGSSIISGKIKNSVKKLQNQVFGS